MNGPGPAKREIFCASAIAIAGPLAFISSVGTNRLGSAAGSSVRLSTEISDTILPASVTVTLRGNRDRQAAGRSSNRKRSSARVLANAPAASRIADRYTPRFPPSAARASQSRRLPEPESKTQVSWCAVEVGRRRSDQVAINPSSGRDRVEQGCTRLVQAEWNDTRRAFPVKHPVRGDLSGGVSGRGFRRPAEPLLGIEDILHFPGAVIFGLTAGAHGKADLEIVTAAGTAQGVTIPRAAKKLKSRFPVRGRVAFDVAR